MFLPNKRNRNFKLTTFQNKINLIIIISQSPYLQKDLKFKKYIRKHINPCEDESEMKTILYVCASIKQVFGSNKILKKISQFYFSVLI